MAERPRYELAALEAKGMFLQAGQNDEKWIQEIGFALQTLRGNDLLQKCDPASIRNAVANIALTGATLNPVLAQAYLVPRENKCCLDFSYRGLLKIAMDSGSVRSIQASVVYDFDIFDYQEGTETFIHFKRNLSPPEEFSADPTKAFWKHLLCVFSIATLHDGSKDHLILPAWKIEKVRNTSKAKSDRAPWGQWPEEQARKTIIKYHYKTLPQSEQMGHAVAVLNEHEGIDITPKDESPQDFMARFDKAIPVEEGTHEDGASWAEDQTLWGDKK